MHEGAGGLLHDLTAYCPPNAVASDEPQIKVPSSELGFMAPKRTQAPDGAAPDMPRRHRRPPAHFPTGNGLRRRRNGCARQLPVILLLLSLVSARACQYNVRDVGFVDLETEPYRLYALVGSNATAGTVSLLQEICPVALEDSNIRFEVVTEAEATNHPASPYLAGGRDHPVPRAVLVSPEGQALSLPLVQPGRPFGDSVLSVLGEVASSPKREELLAAASRRFAAVLLIEGESVAANHRAREAVAQAIDTIRNQMPALPKRIAEPPALVVLEAAALSRERVLLWSLGLDTNTTAHPRAAVIYGRARWIGPLMKGDEITERNLAGLLSIVGADCECGLDVAWTLGTRLPVRWDADRHAQVVRALGFDPANPLVRMEVGRIAGRSGATRTVASGYQEVLLSTDPAPTADGVPVIDNLQPAPNRTPRQEAADVPPLAVVDSAPLLRRALLSVGVLAVVVIVCGAFLLWRRGRSCS